MTQMTKIRHQAKQHEFGHKLQQNPDIKLGYDS